MSPSTGHRGAAALTAAVLLGGMVLPGCTAGHPVTKVSHPVASRLRVTSRHGLASAPVPAGKGTVAAFIASLQGRAAAPFEVKYFIAAGKLPAAIFYAVRPPDELMFAESPIAGRGTRIVKNGSGEYRCVQRGTGQARWACQQLSKAGAAAQAKNLAIYTVAYWAAYLKKVAFAAGAKATTFTMPADAPPTIIKRARAGGMNCLGFHTAAGFGASSVCAAAPGILGSVFLCQGSITIPMEWYSTSPPASLFQLPPGAEVTMITAVRT